MSPKPGELARKAAELKKSKKMLVACQRRERLLKMSRMHEKSDGSRAATPSREKSMFHGDPQYLRDQRYACLHELYQLARVTANRRRFSMKLIALALAVYLISGPAYNLLREVMPLPSRKTLNSRTTTTGRFNPLLLENLSNITSVVRNYRETNDLDSMEIVGFLAVDAIAFDREMVITNDGFVRGGVESEFLDADTLEKIHTDFRELEKLWQEKLDTIISDAFVFQVHPLSAVLRPFVVHVHPSTQGKATNTEVDLLGAISEALGEAGVNVIGFAMDGDSTYRKLHKVFFSEYEDKVRKNESFENFSQIASRLIVSDPLHVLKRARYRLLGSCVHTGLTNNTAQIDIERLRQVLRLPSKVFSNQAFTKMHDDLPVLLFSLETLVTLSREEPAYLSYFLPFCLMNAGLTEDSLSLEERVNFFEVAFYYMLGYLEELKSTKIALPSHKSARSTHVKLFPEELALECTNTLAALLSVIYGFNMTLHLNRVGTNPLEHTFGTVRMRSRYKNTYQKLIKSLGDSETWKRMVSILGVGGKISGRRSCYGKVVDVNLRISPCVLHMNPREVAVAFHIANSLPISSDELECWNINYIAMNCRDVVIAFASNMAIIYKRLYPTSKRISANSRSILVKPGNNHISPKRDVNFGLS